MKEKITVNNRKMYAIRAKSEETERSKNQYLRDLEARAAAFPGNAEVERKLAKERAAAEAMVGRERRECNQQLMDVVAQQRELNARIMKAVKDAKAKMVKNQTEKTESSIRASDCACVDGRGR